MASSAQSADDVERVCELHEAIAAGEVVSLADALGKALLLAEFIMESGSSTLEARLATSLAAGIAKIAGYSGV